MSDAFNLCDYFLSAPRLSEIGSATVIEYRGDCLSYNDLRRQVDGWAARLVASGVSAGDRVALLLYDSPLFIAAFLAATRIGAVSVPINTALPADDVLFIIADSGGSYYAP